LPVPAWVIVCAVVWFPTIETGRCVYTYLGERIVPKMDIEFICLVTCEVVFTFTVIVTVSNSVAARAVFGAVVLVPWVMFVAVIRTRIGTCTVPETHVNDVLHAEVFPHVVDAFRALVAVFVVVAVAFTVNAWAVFGAVIRVAVRRLMACLIMTCSRYI
jgi:hypothetical protein